MADHPPTGSSPRNQREHERLPLQKNALLIARGMKPRPCQLKDICAGGALVDLPARAGAESRELQRGEVVLLRTLLGEGEAARPHELRARIAHTDGDLFGVAFFNPEPAAVATLLDAARAAQPPHAPVATAAVQEIVDLLGQQLLAYAGAACGALFKAADEQLLAAAEHAHSTGEQRLFFEAAARLRKQRDSIRARFQSGLAQAFAGSRADAGPADAAALAQADKEQFEEWLVVKVMAARVEEKCRLPLLALQTRLDALDRQRNTFMPVALCQAFQNAIAPQRFGHVVEKVLYRCLEETVLANLCSVYESLNHTLVQHHVLPRLDVAQQGAGAASGSGALAAENAARATGDFPRRADAAPARPAAAVADLAALRNMLVLQQEQQAVEAGQPAPAALTLPVAAAEVRRIFAMLKAAGEGWQPALEKLVQHGGDNAPATAVLALQRFADNLLQALARHDEQALAWLRQVELALLYVLVSDDAFFRQAEHPLRRLLECLARLGVKDAPSALRADSEAAVARLARDFDSNPDALAETLAVLELLAAKLEQSILRNCERVCRMAEGEQRLVLARRRVQEALDVRLAGRRVPQPLLALLDAGWRDLLTTTWLRHGEQSSLWRDYMGLVDELMAIGADMHRAFDLRELLRLLKAGLEETATVNSRLQQQAIAALKPLLAGPQRLLGEVEWSTLPAPKAESNAEERWLQKWLERARRLQPGDWLELQHRRAEVECLRLAWRDAGGSRFVFVNRLGLKAGDFSLHELATLMHAGNVLTRPGDADSLVDDALARAGYQLYERLAWQATHDALTGLANRPELLRQLERALDAAKRQRVHHVLAVISLDRFERLSSGARAVAEQALKDVAHLLGRALAPRTTVARLGGHEFALLLEECELGKAQQLISLRLGELGAMRPAFEGESIRLTASAGLVDITYTSDSAESVLRAAGEACRQAGQNGGNRIQVYHPSNEEQARRDAVMVWVAKLNEALEGERLALRCQRIEAVGASQPGGPGYEILLGTHADGIDDLPPGEFVQAAERYQRMLAVDRWVVEHSLRWLREHPQQLDRLGLVSINLSTHSLTDAQTLGYILDRLQTYKVPPAKICFEITEAAAIAHLADAADLMRELRRAGCRFALDDFGTGHASCAHLRHLPLDFVKIDGAFVRTLGADRSARTMVRAINELAHYLGMQTIAVFAADAAILAELEVIGVDYAQGYAIGKPHWLDSLA